MNETVKAILRDAGADPESPQIFPNGILLGYKLADSQRLRERVAAEEFAKWAGLRPTSPERMAR